MSPHAFFSELLKLGAISPEHARASLERLESLERTKPTGGQVARYAGLGAAAAPAIGAVANVVRGKGFRGGLHGTTYARDVAADAVKGALGSGAVPLLRNHLDQRAEVGTLKQYIREKSAASAPTRGGFLMASDLPAFRGPRVAVTPPPSQDVAAGDLGVTYKPGDFQAAKLASASPFAAARAAKHVGVPAPRSPTMGMSVKNLAKPRGAGFGSGIPGAFAGRVGGQGPVDLSATRVGPNVSQSA